jgi:hypothetical protein
MAVMFWGLSQHQLKNRHYNWTCRQHWFFLLYAAVLISLTLRTGLIAQPTADSFPSSGSSDAWRMQWASVSTDDDDSDDQLALQDADQDDDSLLLLSVFSLLPLLEAAFFLFHEQQALLSSSFFSPLGARSPPFPAR